GVGRVCVSYLGGKLPGAHARRGHPRPAALRRGTGLPASPTSDSGRRASWRACPRRAWAPGAPPKKKTQTRVGRAPPPGQGYGQELVKRLSQPLGGQPSLPCEAPALAYQAGRTRKGCQGPQKRYTILGKK